MFIIREAIFNIVQMAFDHPPLVFNMYVAILLKDF